jgi:acetyl-CoA acetyltransferase
VSAVQAAGRRPAGLVASFAQARNVRRDDEHNEVEMLMPVVAEVFGNIGITKDDVDFICSGSTDYLIGGPFSFVTALDAVGVWPPRSESHVEMDGAWALYEAWVLLQEGEIDAALVYCFGRSSPGNLNEILALQLDPYYVAPLWPDPVSLAALQARALIDAGKATEADFAAIASRSRRDALDNPKAQVANDIPAEKLLEDEYIVSPLRRHALPPITDGAAAIVLAAGDKARQWSKPGVDHRPRPPDRDPLPRGPRPHVVAVDGQGRRGRRRGRRAGRRGRDPRPLRPPGDHREGGPRPRRLGGRQPVGRPAGGQPADVGRPHPDR